MHDYRVLKPNSVNSKELGGKNCAMTFEFRTIPRPRTETLNHTNWPGLTVTIGCLIDGLDVLTTPDFRTQTGGGCHAEGADTRAVGIFASALTKEYGLL
jgi:hypothetical protein